MFYWLNHWKISSSARVLMLCSGDYPLSLCYLALAYSPHSLQCDKDVSFSSHGQGKRQQSQS